MYLVSSLVSVISQIRARAVKLVVFSLDQQKELYRQENFTLGQLDDVRRAISSLQLGVVGYRTLEHPTGYLDQLTDLAREETTEDSPSHLVVFLGPHTRLNGKPLTDGAMERQGPGAPKFFYLEYMRPVALPSTQSSSDNWLDAAGNFPESPAQMPDIFDYSHMAADATSLPAIYYPTQADESHNDAIDHLMSSLRGRTLIVRKPCDLAKAMQLIAAAK